MRRLLALVAVVALSVLAGSGVASAAALPTVVTAPVATASEIDVAGSTPRVADDDAALPLRNHSVLPAAPLLVQRPHLLPRAVILVLALVAIAVVGRSVRRVERASTGWSPRAHLRVDCAPLRGPPTGMIPALGI
jgi:hypothetical protein